MVFHEVYGELPKGTLALIRKHNVSPSDWHEIEAWIQATGATWKEVNDHIKNMSPGGFYNCPYDYFYEVI